MQNDLTDIIMLLDRSGSMASIRDDTVGGINTFLDAQRQATGRATFTLAQFDHAYEVKRTAEPLESIAPLTSADFQPRGSTALLDAMGRLINETGARLAAMPEDRRPGKVLFVVVTDGEENSSHEFTADRVKEMTTHQSDHYQWEFAFLGANIDSFATAKTVGVPAGNTMNFAATSDGVQLCSATLSAGATHYRSGNAKRGALFTP